MQKIDIRFRVSRIFVALIGLMVVGALVMVGCLALDGLVKLALIVGVLVYGSWILWVDGLLKGVDSILGVELGADGVCWVRYASGLIEAEVKGDSTVTSVLSVLRFRGLGKRKSAVVVFRDSVGEDQYRRLLVWLKCLDTSSQTTN